MSYIQPQAPKEVTTKSRAPYFTEMPAVSHSRQQEMPSSSCTKGSENLYPSSPQTPFHTEF